MWDFHLRDLRDLALDVRDFGAELYIEVVSLDLDSEVESARVAVELGVDWLLGGTRPDAVLPIIAGTPIRYCPFPGRVVGHPSVLSGSMAKSLKVLREWLKWTVSTASICSPTGSPATSRH